MNFNYSVTERIAEHDITVNYNALTGREIILVNGEQKHNRFNWGSLKSEYLLHLDEHSHVRIQLTVTLDSTLNIRFLRSGKVLAEQSMQMYTQPETKVFQEPENAAWLAELALPRYLGLLLAGTLLLLLCLALLKNTQLAATIMGLLTLVYLALLLKPPVPQPPKQPLFSKSFTKVGFIRGMIFGAAFGGIVGYTYSIFLSTVMRLMGTS